jgi:hypothetical protein
MGRQFRQPRACPCHDLILFLAGDVHNNAVLLIAILDEHGTVEVVLVSEFIIIFLLG